MSDQDFFDRFNKKIKEIKNKVDILDYITPYIEGKIRQMGPGEYVCSSPWRRDSDPSFRIYQNEKRFYDYGEQHGGDVIDFVKRHEDCDTAQAVKIISEKLGIDLPWSGGISDEVREEITMRVERKRVKKVSTDYILRCHDKLLRNKPLLEWIKSQYGFDHDTILRFKLGYSDGDVGKRMLEEGRYSVDHLLETGLFFIHERGSEIHAQEVHKRRLIFPYMKAEECAYTISRHIPHEVGGAKKEIPKYLKGLVHDDSKHPHVSKYVNNDVFFGEDTIQGAREIVITEGVTDAISAIEAHLGVISPVTTRFKKSDIERAVKLCKNAEKVTILNDNEAPKKDPHSGRMTQPGLDGAVNMAEAFLEAGIPVYIGKLPRAEGQSKVDLNSLLRDNEDGLAQLYSTIEKAEDGLLEVIRHKYKGMFVSDSTHDTQLSGVCKLIGQRPPTQRDQAVQLLAQVTQGSNQKLIHDLAESFAKKKKEEKDRLQRKARLSILREMPGYIEEDEEGYYFCEREVGKKVVTDVVTNFAFRPKYSLKIKSENGGEVVVNSDIYVGTRDAYIRNVNIPMNAFTGTKELRKFLSGVSNRLIVNTTDHQTSFLQHFLHTEEEAEGVRFVGRFQTEDGRKYFVSTKGVFDMHGEVEAEDRPVIQCSDQESSIAAGLHLDAMNGTGANEARSQASFIYKKLFELNDDKIIVGLVSWFCAASILPDIMKVMGSFPLMEVSGMAGSGKTTIVKNVMLPLFSAYDGPLQQAGLTRFALLKSFTTTSSIPVFTDENRGLSESSSMTLERFMRSAYNQGYEERGQSSLKVKRFRMTSPLGIIGEYPFQDPALRERLVGIQPMVASITPARAAALREILKFKSGMLSLGALFNQWSLSLDTDTLIMSWKADFESMGFQGRERPIQNLMCQYFGWKLFILWLTHLNVSTNKLPEFASCAEDLIQMSNDSECGSVGKNNIETFIEGFSQMAYEGILVEDRHYLIYSKIHTDHHVWIPLPVCLPLFLKWHHQMGSKLEKGLYEKKILNKTLREMKANQATYPYLLDTQVVRLIHGRKTTGFVVDFKRLPSHLGAIFPRNTPG